MPITNLTSIARSPGDPRIVRKGPISLTRADRLARALGWFSVGLGFIESLVPGRLARSVGLDGEAGVIRACGARELAAAIPTLSVDKSVGLAARIAGDVIDLGVLATALRRGNPKRRNAAVATALVAGVTLLDVIALTGVRAAHRRGSGSERDYSGRTGLPRGAHASEGLARRDFETPADYATEGDDGNRAEDDLVLSADSRGGAARRKLAAPGHAARDGRWMSVRH